MNPAAIMSDVVLPLFVAMSPLTAIPMFLSITQDLSQERSRHLARQAVVTAFVVAVGIVVLGESVFSIMGITVDDMRIAGGIILLLIAIHDLLFTRESRKTIEMDSDPGVVPLGIPLIVGPATMTTCLILSNSQGKALVVFGLAFNLAVVGLLLFYSDIIQKYVRPSISRAFGKVMSLFLAAIAVATFRAGLSGFLSGLSV